jgi:hypothetical protein
VTVVGPGTGNFHGIKALLAPVLPEGLAPWLTASHVSMTLPLPQASDSKRVASISSLAKIGRPEYYSVALPDIGRHLGNWVDVSVLGSRNFAPAIISSRSDDAVRNVIQVVSTLSSR